MLDVHGGQRTDSLFALSNGTVGGGRVGRSTHHSAEIAKPNPDNRENLDVDTANDAQHERLLAELTAEFEVSLLGTKITRRLKISWWFLALRVKALPREYRLNTSSVSMVG